MTNFRACFRTVWLKCRPEHRTEHEQGALYVRDRSIATLARISYLRAVYVVLL